MKVIPEELRQYIYSLKPEKYLDKAKYQLLLIFASLQYEVAVVPSQSKATNHQEDNIEDNSEVVNMFKVKSQNLLVMVKS